MKMSLYAPFLTAYLCVSYIFWLPFLDPAGVASIKYAILAAIGASFVIHAARSGELFPIGKIFAYAMMFFWIPATAGLIQTTPDGVWSYAQDVVYPLVFICFGYAYSRRLLRNRHLYVGIVISSAFFAGSAVILTLMGVEYYQSFGDLLTSQTISGYGGLRTGWSNGLAMPLVMAITLFLKESSKKGRLLFLLLAFCIFMSQIIVAGRTGIVSAICSISFTIFLCNVSQRAQLVRLVFWMIIFLSCVHIFYKDLIEVMRFSAEGGTVDLDKFSSGRMGLMDEALAMIQDKPFVGYGFDIKIGVHNEVLKYFIQSGLLYPVCMVLFWIIIFVTAVKNDRALESDGRAWVSPVILCGLVIAQLEPSMLIGSFQIAAIWWAAVGMTFGEQYWRLRRPPPHLPFLKASKVKT